MKDSRVILRGEAMLLLAIMINSIGVLLMLQSGSGISAISSVPYAFSEVFPKLTLGTWTYIFQGLLVITLMVLKIMVSLRWHLGRVHMLFTNQASGTRMRT